MDKHSLALHTRLFKPTERYSRFFPSGAIHHTISSAKAHPPMYSIKTPLNKVLLHCKCMGSFTLALLLAVAAAAAGFARNDFTFNRVHRINEADFRPTTGGAVSPIFHCTGTGTGTQNSRTTTPPKRNALHFCTSLVVSSKTPSSSWMI